MKKKLCVFIYNIDSPDSTKYFIDRTFEGRLCNVELIVPLFIKKYLSNSVIAENVSIQFIDIPINITQCHALELIFKYAMAEYILILNAELNVSMENIIKIYDYMQFARAEDIISFAKYQFIQNFDNYGYFTGDEYVNSINNTNRASDIICSSINVYSISYLKKLRNEILIERVFDDLFLKLQIITLCKKIKIVGIESSSLIENLLSISNKKIVSESLYNTCEDIRLYCLQTSNNNQEFLESFNFLLSEIKYLAQRLFELYLKTSVNTPVIIFTEEGCAEKYGIGTYIKLLTNSIESKERDIVIIHLHTKNQTILWRIINKEVHYYIPSNMSNMYLDYSDEKYYKSVLYFVGTVFNRDKRIICHFNFWQDGLLAEYLKKKLNAFILFTVHYTQYGLKFSGDIEYYKNIVRNPKSKSERYMQRLYYMDKNFVSNTCDVVIAIANHSRVAIEHLYMISPRKLYLIPHGLIDEYIEIDEHEKFVLRKKYGFKSSEKLLVYAGRLEPIKGVFALIKAFRILLNKIHNLKLIIIGSGDYTSCMKEGSGIWSKIVFTGYISKAQMYEIFLMSDLGVMPSYYEEFGYVALEMIMNKLPLLVNNTTGLSEISKNCKNVETFEYGCSECELSELMYKILNLLNSPKDNRLLQENRNDFLQHYEYSVFKTNMLDLYASIETLCST